MGLLHYLFGFSGRINRAKQWAVLLVGLVFTILFQVAFALIVGWSSVGAAFQEKTPILTFISTPQFRAFLLVCAGLYLLVLYIYLAVMTKRLHDRDKSAVWLLVFFALPIALQIPALMDLPHVLAQLGEAIKAAQASGQRPMTPIYEPPLVVITRGAATIISLWAFVELYILRGTTGDNRFGPDPLAGRA
jgi:uncharacterized membrane protein YhaH (DUF805 family)